MTDVIQVVAGDYHTCALVADGTVACWGYNTFGQLGDGTSSNRTVPVAITGGALTSKRVVQLAAGKYHTCALISDGTVSCWGWNEYGQLGDNTELNSKNSPVAITGGALTGKTVTHLAAGIAHTCAVLSDGTVSCWGWNDAGQVGVDIVTVAPTPQEVSDGALTGKTVKGITAGWTHTCATIADGSVSCWGDNDSGQLGDGTTADRRTPVAVTGGVLSRKPVASIDAGANHTCARLGDGSLSCWGNNDSGQLGTGSFTTRTTPVDVPLRVRSYALSIPYATGTSRVGQTLTANPGTWTGYPTPSLSYQWYSCSSQVLAATQSSLPLGCIPLDGAISAQLVLTSAHAGSYITVAVTGTNAGFDPMTWSTASTSTKVVMTAAATVKPSIKGTAKVGKTLTASKGTWTGSPTPTFKYQWYACTAKISLARISTSSKCRALVGATKSTLKLRVSHQGKFITVVVTGTSAGTDATKWMAKSTSTKVK